MKLLNFLGKIVKWVFLLLVLPVLIYLGLAALLSYWGTNPKKLDCTADQTIYISSNGMHIDLIIPSTGLSPVFASQLSPKSATQYYSIGWGDKGFYLDTPSWAELKLSTGMRAMLIKSPTAMHVTQFQTIQPHWVPIAVCSEQITTLNNYITSTFERDAAGNLMEIVDAGYTPNDRFYEAHGNYTGVKTCNIWVSLGLKKASIKTSRWSPFVFGILHHAEEQAGSSLN